MTIRCQGDTFGHGGGNALILGCCVGTASAFFPIRAVDLFCLLFDGVAIRVSGATALDSRSVRVSNEIAKKKRFSCHHMYRVDRESL